MRIVHVSPHLPPDQAANALLPSQLGRWMAERGNEVAFVAHEAAQERRSALMARPIFRCVGSPGALRPVLPFDDCSSSMPGFSWAA
jgi:hypothetical protein